jgi:hypothetical protein
MKRDFYSATESHIAYFVNVCAIAVCLWLLSAAVSAQDSQTGSLADVARQVRAQKQTQPTTDSSQAQQVANQLSDDQNADNAPAGFKTYNAGDYKLSVPAPYTVDGHDDAGVVLSGPMVGSKRPVILVGTPMVFQWGDNEGAFLDASTKVARLYSQSAKCSKITVAEHTAYQCNLAGANLLGRTVSGNAVFVKGSHNIYPVFCVAPTDSRARDVLNDPHSSFKAKAYAKEALDREDQDVKRAWQKCGTVFQSIHLKPEIVQQRSAQTGGAATTAQTPLQTGSTRPTASSSVSPTAGSAGAAADTVPAGYKVHPFQYCSGQNCWNASVLVTADAQLVSSDCKRSVFETKVQGILFLLLAGPGGGDCNGPGASAAALVRWKQLADPESSRAPGTYSTISSQMTKLDGKTATITTLSFRNGLTEWKGKRIEVESNGASVVVGCMAPREHFDDGEAICSTMIGSLQLP